MSHDTRIRNVVRRVLNEDWAIWHEKLEQIVAYLEMRDSGRRLEHSLARAPPSFGGTLGIPILRSKHSRSLSPAKK